MYKHPDVVHFQMGFNNGIRQQAVKTTNEYHWSLFNRFQAIEVIEQIFT
jgi:hypothetical protein